MRLDIVSSQHITSPPASWLEQEPESLAGSHYGAPAGVPSGVQPGGGVERMEQGGWGENRGVCPVLSDTS